MVARDDRAIPIAHAAVDREHLHAARAEAFLQDLHRALGPALAGVLVAAVGFGWTYSVDVVLFVFAFLGIVTLPAIVPEGQAARPGWASLVEGMRFLKTAPNVRMSFMVDLIAMTFGQDRKSQGWKRYAEARNAHPRRVVR